MFKRKGTGKRYRFYQQRLKGRKGGRFLDLGITVLGLLTLLFLLSSVRRLTQTQAEGSLKTTPLRMQILNASGHKLNPALIRLLREKDLNKYYLVIVDQRDFPDSLVKETLLLDRIGDKKIAQQVGGELGLKKGNILFQRLEGNDQNISYTLILGKDYRNLFKLKD